MGSSKCSVWTGNLELGLKKIIFIFLIPFLFLDDERSGLILFFVLGSVLLFWLAFNTVAVTSTFESFKHRWQ